MRVARISLNRLPLTAALSDGHHVKGRRGGSLNRFFAERKGESEAPRYARLYAERDCMDGTRFFVIDAIASKSNVSTVSVCLW